MLCVVYLVVYAAAARRKLHHMCFVFNSRQQGRVRQMLRCHWNGKKYSNMIGPLVILKLKARETKNSCSYNAYNIL